MSKFTANKIFLTLQVWKFNLTIGWGLTHDIRCDLGISLFDFSPDISYLNILSIGIWLLRINLGVDLRRSNNDRATVPISD